MFLGKRVTSRRSSGIMLLVFLLSTMTLASSIQKAQGQGPVPVISSLAPDPTNSAFEVTIDFAASVDASIFSHLNYSNCNWSNPTSVSGDDSVWTLQITPITNGVVTVQVPAGIYQDTAENWNTASNLFSRTYDAQSPIPVITSTAPDPTKSDFEITIDFDATVDASVFPLLNYSNCGWSSPQSVSGDDSVWTLQIAPIVDGEVTVQVPAGIYQDAALNWNSESNLFSITYGTHGWEVDFTIPSRHPVVDFAVHSQSLYAAADSRLYVYDGSSWNAVDAPVFVTSLESCQGELVIGGQGGLYHYDGAAFGLIFSVPTYIRVLGVYDNKLYAGTILANPPQLYYCNGIANNPSDWHVDTAFSTVLNFSGAFGSIDSFAVYGGVMYLGSGGKLYSFNGGSWSIVVSHDDVCAFVDMQVYNDKLYLTTRDQAWRKPYYQGGTGFSGRVIEFDGENWATILDHDYWVYSLGVYDGKLYAGTANKIFTFDGTDWEVAFNATEGAYYALCFENYDDKIYVGMGNGYIFADPAPPKPSPETTTVPEFSPIKFLTVFMMATLPSAILLKKRKHPSANRLSG